MQPNSTAFFLKYRKKLIPFNPVINNIKYLTMFRIEMLPAEYGDCLWIEYGKPNGKTHRVLIDGGLAGCGKILRKRINALDPDDRHFDLVVVTHIDTDHINGIINLLKNMPEGFCFDYFWFNGYDQIKPQGVLGVPQGIELTDLLLKLEKKENRKFWNKPFRRKAVMLPASGIPKKVKLKGGMKMTILGPTVKGITVLYKEWDRVVREALSDKGKETPPVSEAENLFTPRELEEISVEELAREGFIEDDSPSNGSSIVLLAEYDGQKILLTGDAFPGDIVEGVSRLAAPQEKINLNAVKLPHHGSKNNNSNALFEAFSCRNFMVSTNGRKHGHPDRQGIARILVNNAGGSTLYFNYSHEGNKIWTNPELQQDYRYNAIYADNGNLKITLKE